MEDALIMRKITALLARAEDGASSPAEVEHAIRIADKLMRRYNLSRDEVRLRREEMRRSARAVDRATSEFANMIAVAIARLAQCRLTGERAANDRYTFTGLRVDVDYAEWLFRASLAALHQGWRAYQASPQHAQLAGEGAEPGVIERHYKLGFSIDLAERIKALAQDAAESTGTALVCLKRELIEQAFGAGSKTSVDLVCIKGDLQPAYRSGVAEARKVGLRQTLERQKVLHLGLA